MNEPIDFEKLLRKYMLLVAENEGVTFVRYLAAGGDEPSFTQAEVDYLQKLNNELP